MTGEAPLIVVIDDDARVCKATARMLDASGFRVRTHTSAGEFLAHVDARAADCVLADIRMPEQSGIALAQAMRGVGIEVPIVYMTAAADVPTAVDAMKQGAVDLLAKPFSGAALLEALDRAMDVGRRTQASHRALAALWSRVARLTAREAEICGLVSAGIANKQVAALSGITEKTVKVHRGRVMHKLGAGSLAELVRVVDKLAAAQDRVVLRVDGAEIERPAVVGVMLAAAARLARAKQGTDELPRSP